MYRFSSNVCLWLPSLAKKPATVTRQLTKSIGFSPKFISVTSISGDDSRAPSMCLVCGEVVCSQSYCCQAELDGEAVGACTAHAHTCGARVGIFLRYRTLAVALYRTLLWIRIRIHLAVLDPDPCREFGSRFRSLEIDQKLQILYTWFSACQKCLCTFVGTFLTYFLLYIFHTKILLFMALKSAPALFWFASPCLCCHLLMGLYNRTHYYTHIKNRLQLFHTYYAESHLFLSTSRNFSKYRY